MQIKKQYIRVIKLGLALLTCASFSEAQPDRELTRSIFKELIEINTTHSAGSTTKAAEAMAARLRNAGFPDRDLFIGGPVDRKGNLVVTLHGSGKRKPLLLLAHLDVVEALPSDWTTDPFKFEEIDGFYYARGSSDDKAMAAIFVSNLIRLKKEGVTPDRTIILALTADEEGGDYNGIEWLLKNHRDLIQAEFAINEGGGGESKNGKKMLNRVQVAEKVFQTFTFEVKNRGGHSSQPRKDNAIYTLARGLDTLSRFEFPVNLNEATRTYFERTARVEGGSLGEDMLGLLQSPPRAESVSRLSESPFYNALIRTTCVATMVSAGHAENALAQTATATVNCRVLPGEDPAQIKNQLIALLNNNEISVSVVRPASPSPASPLTSDMMGSIERVTKKLWPGTPVIPSMSTGATDGRPLRNAGIPTYGVSGLFSETNDNRMHGKDERIGVASFYEGQEFLYQLVNELAMKTNVKRDY